MDDTLVTIQQVQSKAIDMAAEFGPRLLIATLILAAGWFVNRWAGRWFERALARFAIEAPLRVLMVRGLRVLVFGLFFVIALQNLGVELLPLIAGLGVAGAGIALAMQGVLGNAAAGLTIIFTRPFHVGEYISIADEEGVVLDITLFSTTLGHVDRSRVVIPNRKIVGEILHNFGTVRQLDIPVTVAYGTDLSQAIATVREVLEANPRVLKEPAPVVYTLLLGASGIDLAVRPWVAVADFGAARSEINQTVEAALRKCGISIPFPQREIRVLGKD
jgi:small conductance mechanosensitive channel